MAGNEKLSFLVWPFWTGIVTFFSFLSSVTQYHFCPITASYLKQQQKHNKNMATSKRESLKSTWKIVFMSSFIPFFIALHFFPVIVAHLFSFRHHFIILRVSYAILLRLFFLLSFHLILSRYLWWYLLFYCVDNGDDYLIVVSYTGRPHVAESQAVKWSLYLSVVVVMKKFIWIECNERRRNRTVWSFISFVWGVRLWLSTWDAFVSLQLSRHWWTSFSHLFFSCFVSYHNTFEDEVPVICHNIHKTDSVYDHKVKWIAFFCDIFFFPSFVCFFCVGLFQTISQSTTVGQLMCTVFIHRSHIILCIHICV